MATEVVSEPTKQTIVDFSEEQGQVNGAVGAKQIIDFPKRQNKEDEQQISGVVFLLVLTTSGLAVFLDGFGVFSFMVSVPTAGTVGWILRITMSLIKAVYLGLFGYLSFRPEFGGGQISARQARTQARQFITITVRWLPRLLRIVGVAEFGLDFIYAIGDIADALPIETASVVLLFVVYPRLQRRLEQAQKPRFKEVPGPEKLEKSGELSA
jgi:hypothetical protein